MTRYTSKELNTEAIRAYKEERKEARKQDKTSIVLYQGWELILGEHACLQVTYSFNGRQVVHNIAI